MYSLCQYIFYYFTNIFYFVFPGMKQFFYCVLSMLYSLIYLFFFLLYQKNIYIIYRLFIRLYQDNFFSVLFSHEIFLPVSCYNLYHTIIRSQLYIFIPLYPDPYYTRIIHRTICYTFYPFVPFIRSIIPVYPFAWYTCIYYTVLLLCLVYCVCLANPYKHGQITKNKRFQCFRIHCHMTT